MVITTSAIHAQDRPPTDKTITFKGNVFTVKDFSDTATMLDLSTLEVATTVKDPSPIPVKMNALNIYGKDDVDKLPGVTEQTIKYYLLHKLGDKVTSLGNGEYRLVLNSVVISDKGRIVFYDFIGLERHTRHKITEPGTNKISYQEQWTEISSTQMKLFKNAVDDILQHAPKYRPALSYNNAVPCRLSDEAFKKPFYIKGGILSFTK